MQININLILRYNFYKHEIHRDFPGDPVFKTSPSNVGVQTRSLIGELRSYMPHGQKTRT